jgi:hypothetical protein
LVARRSVDRCRRGPYNRPTDAGDADKFEKGEFAIYRNVKKEGIVL